MEQKQHQPLDQEPINWFWKNLGTINHILFEEMYSHILEGEAVGRRTQCFNPKRRRKTEMSLCYTWFDIETKCGLPEGFSKKWGEYSVDGSDYREGHEYLERIDDDGTITWFCHVASQFMFENDKFVGRGERMKELRRRAVEGGKPELVSVVGNFYLIYGKAEDIKTILGLNFKTLEH